MSLDHQHQARRQNMQHGVLSLHVCLLLCYIEQLLSDTLLGLQLLQTVISNCLQLLAQVERVEDTLPLTCLNRASDCAAGERSDSAAGAI